MTKDTHPQIEYRKAMNTGLPVTDRMQRYGVTGLIILPDKCEIAQGDAHETAPAVVGLWLAERL